MKKTIAVFAVLMVSLGLAAKDKDKKGGNQVVDSGSFGIFMSGRRIGTETFRIEQKPEISIASSELKVDDGNFKADQSSEMQIAPNGNLRSYTWHSSMPEKAEATVEPKDDLLVEHFTTGELKKQEVPYALPASTVILDDNFFSQREILVWRYLASGCLPKDKQLACGPGYFGILVPHQHTSASAVMELMGREKITYKGTEKELNKFRLESDGVNWFLWADDQYKVMKMSVPSVNIEVVRD